MAAEVFLKMVLFLFCLHGAKEASGDVAVLSTTGPKRSQDFCVIYNPTWYDIPRRLEDTPKYDLLEAKPSELCTEAENAEEIQGKAVAVQRGLCSLNVKGANALKAKASEIIIISNESLFTPGVNESFRMAVLSHKDWKSMKSFGNPLVIQLYAPPAAVLDGNLAVLWLVALLTVAIGAYWAGITSKPDPYMSRPVQHSAGDDDGGNGNDDADTVQFTPLMVIFFVAMIIAMLLLLYYFYRYLVYVVIVLFCLASSHGLFECLYPVVLWLPLGSCKVPSIPFVKKQPQFRVIMLALFCMSVAIWWGIERNSSYGWALQDILGIAFCISLLKAIRLPNLKVCILLLLLLLIYDIFFVFITPLFSANGDSVMVKVATGDGNKEQLPMVLKIPRLTKSTLSVCERPYSILGFGDILVPGLYIAFCHCFDVITNTPKKIYYIGTTIAYGVGLLITFLALYLMKEGQPALLYLVPCILLTGCAIGWWRGEMRSLWEGPWAIQGTSTLAGSHVYSEHSESDEEIFDASSEQPNPETQRLVKEVKSQT